MSPRMGHGHCWALALNATFESYFLRGSLNYTWLPFPRCCTFLALPIEMSPTSGKTLCFQYRTIGIWDYVLSVCDWVCVHNFKPEVFLFESTSALNLSCPKISQRYLSGSPMCLASHGMIEVMLMQTLTKTFLAWKQNIPGLKMRGSEIGDWTFWNLKLFQDAYRGEKDRRRDRA